MSTDPAAARALELIGLLSEDVGPRRPTSAAEAEAASRIAAELEAGGAEARIEEFPGYSSFAWPFGVILGLAAGAGLVPRRRGLARALAAVPAAVLGALEDGLRNRVLSRLLAGRGSVNLIASVEPAGEVERTLCLVSHLDTSRSGLIFAPGALPHLRRLISASSAAVAVSAAEPLLGRVPGGRGLVGIARAYLLVALGLLAERELRGEDVPGANDNASGVAVSAALTAEVAGAPLAGTRLVMLATGCEESGVLGAEAFAEGHPEAADWIFVNLDGVAAPATLRYLRREGLTRKWDADAGLVGLCESLAAERPELGLEPSEGEAGLTYDATPLLARGMRAITLSVSDGVIPNYHHPDDDLAHVEPEVVGRAVEVTRELIGRIDAGALD